MKQNNATELSGYSFDNIYNKNGPPDALDPKSVFFARFPGFAIEDRRLGAGDIRSRDLHFVGRLHLTHRFWIWRAKHRTSGGLHFEVLRFGCLHSGDFL